MMGNSPVRSNTDWGIFYSAKIPNITTAVSHFSYIHFVYLAHWLTITFISFSLIPLYGIHNSPFGPLEVAGPTRKIVMIQKCSPDLNERGLRLFITLRRGLHGNED